MPRIPLRILLKDSAMLLVWNSHRQPPSSYALHHFSGSLNNPLSHCLPWASVAVFSFSSFSLKNCTSFWRQRSSDRAKLSLSLSFLNKFSARCRVHQRWCKGAYPGIYYYTALSIPWCLSEMTQTSLPGPTTCIRTRRKNHSQLSLFSFSTKANARGTNALSASQEMATKSVPMYFPNRKVPSIENIGRQCLKDSIDCGKH